MRLVHELMVESDEMFLVGWIGRVENGDDAEFFETSLAHGFVVANDLDGDEVVVGGVQGAL
jgi:hypothetical protein